MGEFEKIYLAGHAGLLGKSVYQEFVSENYEVVTRNSSDLDLRIEKDVSDFIKMYEVKFLYEHVIPISEFNDQEKRKIN